MNKYIDNQYTINELENEIMSDALQNNLSYFDWYVICRYQKLTENFIIKYINHIYWSIIAEYQNLSYDFMKKNINKIEFKILLNNKIISNEIKVKIKELKEGQYK
jgi:hypothetical protein